jgi:mutator protein MutT
LTPQAHAGERPVHVAAGVLVDGRGRVLIAQRPPGKHMAGAWEFPGGKLEPGEAPADGLRRELKEEIGVDVAIPRPLMRLRHRYAYGEVLLDVWVIRQYRGEPRSLDNQALRWCNRAELSAAPLLPADRPIVAALSLPMRLRRAATRLYGISEFSGGELRSGRQGLEGIACRDAAQAEKAAERGAAFVVLREALPDSDLKTLCGRLDIPVYARGIAMAHAWSLGATGINSLAA